MNTETSANSIILEAPLDLPHNHKTKLAWKDFKDGCNAWRIWWLLAWQDIRLRYRRSQLGPFWITISMAITIYTMGFLYGHIFKQDLRDYYPFLAAGMLTWNLLTLLIVDGTNTFIEADTYLKQMKLPYTVFILRVVSRSLIVFAHNILVIIPLIIIFGIKISLADFMLIPGLLIIVFNGVLFGMILATLGARYRDFSQIVSSLMQVAFFLTPVMWKANLLSARYQFINELNPFAQFVELLRAPLIGTMPSLYTLLFCCAVTVFGIILCCYVFVKTRHRIIYWL